MNSTRDIVGVVRELQECRRLKDFSPYCIGIVGKEEAEILDCREGEEYALFHGKHRGPLCDWFGGKFNVEQLARALLIAVEGLETQIRNLADMHVAKPPFSGGCVDDCRACQAQLQIADTLSRIRSLPLHE